MKSRIRKDRLLTLATVLEALDGYIEPQFNMAWWTQGTGGTGGLFGGNDPTDSATTPKELSECATSACAGGYAASIPAFRREGLTLLNGRPHYRGATGNDACKEFFGLTDRQSKRIFGGDEERTLAQEVRVIRQFVARAA